MKTITKVKINSGVNTLKQIRESLEMSQIEFAKAIGATQRSIVRWENGYTKPLFSISQVKKLNILLQRLGLTLNDLPDDLVS